MAENNKGTIFQRALHAFRKDPRSGINQAPMGHTPMASTQNMDGYPTRVNPSSPVNSLEHQQQQYLDWQMDAIAQDIYTRTVYYDTDRVGAYQDYNAMDHSPEIAAALDIIRDECLVRNERGNILEIYSENDRVKEVLKDLFNNKLNVEYNMRLWIRELVKKGDFFLHLHIDGEGRKGVYDVMALPAEEIHREDGVDGMIDNTRFRWDSKNMYFEEWQIAHFRLIEDTKRLPYGRSMLDPARKLWKQLQLSEDAMLVYRLARAPERRVFYIDVGNIDDADVKQYIDQVKLSVKGQPVVNSKTGDISRKFNPAHVEEDFFIPIRGDKSSKIETLPGACLALDTEICLLDGRNLELNEIIEEFKVNKNLWSYSINPETGEIVPGKITWAGVTRKDTEVVKITLDNGETITTTPDHKFPTRFNGIKEAKDLQPNESLWSFNKKLAPVSKDTRKKRNDYEMVFDHSSNDWVYTHRLVANYFKSLGEHNELVFNESSSDKSKQTIHHQDYDRFNNNPSNLHFMNNKDHRDLHADNIYEWSKLGVEAWMKKFDNDEEFKQEVLLRLEKSRTEYYANRDGETTQKHNESISKGIKEYFNNISKEEAERRKGINIKNISGANARLKELMQDECFKQEMYEKSSKNLKIVKNTPEYKEIQSGISKNLWKDESYRNAIAEKQTIKYADSMLQFVVNLYKKGFSAKDIVIAINEEGSTFMEAFNSLNEGNKQLKKMENGFTHNNLVKLMSHFGYDNWRDFKNKAELFNHRIVSIEFLEEKVDTGTITIDGGEKYHDHHNFALASGVFTQNSNMGDIADIEYLENKLFAALKVPKPYLNYAESMPGGSMLSQADLRFARTINSIQESVLMELRRIANIHLMFTGFEDDIDNFTLTLTNPSSQQELLNLETWRTRLEIFKEMFNTEPGSPTSYTWAMENILGFSQAEIKLMFKQKKVEKKLFTEIEAAAETYKKIGLFKDLDKRYEDPEKAAAAEGGGAEGGGEDEFGGDLGGGGGLGGGLGGDLGGLGGDLEGDLDDEELGGEELGDEEGLEGTEEAPEEESEALSESKKAKYIKRELKESDKRYGEYFNELFQEEKKPANSLLNNYEKSNTKSLKLKSSMKSVEKIIKERGEERRRESELLINEIAENEMETLQESVEFKSNKLHESNDELNKRAREAIERVNERMKKPGNEQ